MDPELLSAFTDEAENMLQGIRGGILVCLQDGRPPSDLGGILGSVQSLKGAAATLGLNEIEETTQLLENKVRSFIASRESFSHSRTHELLDILARIVASIGKIRMDSDKHSINLSDFVDESFDNLQICTSGQSVAQTETNVAELSVESGFEIDAEMLEIFSMEADDLLKNIESNLDKLAIAPDDRDALWEVRRNAHTFKGAAGIVGFKKPSELAHRVEDLLDHLAEHGISPDERIHSLLLASTDCLRSITAGERSPQFSARLDQVYEDFDAVLRDLGNKTMVPIKATPAEIPEAAIEIAAKVVQPRSIVRVSLKRLDELVKIVHGLVVSRSVFEQRLTEFDQQIEELQNSTRRLKSTNTKLETNFEASMLGSVVNSATGRGKRSELVNNPFSPTSFNDPLHNYTGPDFDPLEFDRYTEFHESTRELTETTSDTFAINTALEVVRGNLESLFDHQRRLIEDMQEKLMHIRMVAFSTVVTRLQRSVHVTCEEERKHAELTVENQHLEIDTQILDSLVEPLIHLIRNAVVHGIESPDTRRLLGKPETGRINIRLINEETHIVVQVSDDGRGIAVSSLKEKAFLSGLVARGAADAMSEEEVFELMFVAGLTTAEKLNLSAGRGVGMSIVRESIEARMGEIVVNSVPQKGTTFTVRIPLPLAVTKVLLVKVNRQTFAIPVKLIHHIGEFSSSDIKQSGSNQTLELASGNFAVKHLATYIGVENSGQTRPERINVVLLETSDMACALVVDEALKAEEVVIKPLGKPLDGLKGTIGAAILGSGDVVPILDIPFLLNDRKKKKKTSVETVPVQAEKPTVMIVDDSPSIRHMTTKVIENAGWPTVTAKDGIEALAILQSGAALPAIILTDVEMPRMDGYDLASTIKKTESLKEIPVVFITSRGGKKHRDRAAELGIEEYLTKPFADAELIETVKRLSKRDQGTKL